MAHKKIQITDENGILAGLATSPNEARQNRQIRLISRVNLTDPSGEKYLLQKRATHMHTWPGRWDNSAAGHVDEGETPEQAAYRELDEEIGISKITLTLETKLYHDHPIEENGTQNRMYSYFYKGIFSGDINQLKLDPEEVSEVRWFTLKEITELLKNQPDSVTDGIMITFQDLL